MPSISVDYAFMEKAPSVAAIRGDLGWSDVGTLEAHERVGVPVAELQKKDKTRVVAEPWATNAGRAVHYGATPSICVRGHARHNGATPSISVDQALMEKAPLVAAIRAIST